jgi:hypothetical protein
MNGAYDDQPPAPPDACPNRLCAQFRIQHRNITQKRNELEKELDVMRRKHDALYNQVVTRGEASMMHEAVTGEDGMRMPNGEMMTAEKFLAKTRMMNQCRESLQVSEKKSRLFAEENARLKLERDSLYASMRKFENMLHGFERARPFEVFTDEAHRNTLRENEQLVDMIEKLRRVERETREENAALRRKMQVYKKREILSDGGLSPKKRARCVDDDE